MTDSVAQDQLCAFVGRIEGLEATIRDLNSDKSEVYKEAKGSGFDIKVLRKVIADRRKDYSERVEFETIYDLYMAALGGVAHAHVENIDEFDPETGEITDDTITRGSGNVFVDLGFTEQEGREIVAAHQSRNGETGSDSLDSVVGTPSASTGSDQTGNLSMPHSSAPALEQALHGSRTGGSAVALPGDGQGKGVRGADGAEPNPWPEPTVKPEGSQGSSAPLKFGDAKPLRPHCLTPNNCGGQGKSHCWSCRQASGEAA